MPAATSGATKFAFAAVALLSVTVVPPVCDQEKESVSPASGSEPLPSNCTIRSSSAIWLAPALAIGARFAGASSPPPPLQAVNVTAETTSSNGLAIAANDFLIVLPKRVFKSGLPDRWIMATALKLSMIYCDLRPLPIFSIDRIWPRW